MYEQRAVLGKRWCVPEVTSLLTVEMALSSARWRRRRLGMTSRTDRVVSARSSDRQSGASWTCNTTGMARGVSDGVCVNTLWFCVNNCSFFPSLFLMFFLLSDLIEILFLVVMGTRSAGFTGLGPDLVGARTTKGCSCTGISSFFSTSATNVSANIVISINMFLYLSTCSSIFYFWQWSQTENCFSVDPERTLLLNQGTSLTGLNHAEVLSPLFPCFAPQKVFNASCAFRWGHDLRWFLRTHVQHFHAKCRILSECFCPFCPFGQPLVLVLRCPEFVQRGLLVKVEWTFSEECFAQNTWHFVSTHFRSLNGNNMKIDITEKLIHLRRTRNTCDNNIKIKLPPDISTEYCNPKNRLDFHGSFRATEFHLIFTKTVDNDGDKFWFQITGKPFSSCFWHQSEFPVWSTWFTLYTLLLNGADYTSNCLCKMWSRDLSDAPMSVQCHLQGFSSFPVQPRVSGTSFLLPAYPRANIGLNWDV